VLNIAPTWDTPVNAVPVNGLETAIGEAEAALNASFASPLAEEVEPVPFAVGFGTTALGSSSDCAEPEERGAVGEAVALRWVDQYEPAADASVAGIGMTPPPAYAVIRWLSTVGHSTPAPTAITPAPATANPTDRRRARSRAARTMEFRSRP
jgi:hypothetical protein